MKTFIDEEEGCVEIDFGTMPHKCKVLKIDMGACDDECKGEQVVEVHRGKVVVKTLLNGNLLDEQELEFPDFFQMYAEEMAGAAEQLRDAMEDR